MKVKARSSQCALGNSAGCLGGDKLNIRFVILLLFLGQLFSVAVLILGIAFHSLAPICEVLLVPGSRIAVLFPGGGMHNPVANVAGFVANGVLFAIPFFIFGWKSLKAK